MKQSLLFKFLFAENGYLNSVFPRRYVCREEGKVSRKLIECINTFLSKDGPNLGCRSFEIHNAVQQFVFRCWLTTRDRGLKVSS